jgi:hypothetical protein
MLPVGFYVTLEIESYEGGVMASGGFVSALEAQHERTKLLDQLYDSLEDVGKAEAARRIRHVSSRSERLSRRHEDKRSCRQQP